jgi:hypothetical protein
MSTISARPGAHAASDRPPAPAWLHLTLCLAWIAAGIYWFITFSGPFRWLAELQNAWLGVHSRLLSSGLPVIVGFFASELVASRLLGTRMLGKDENPLASLAGLKRLAPVAVLAGGLLFAGSEYRKSADAGEMLAATPGGLAAHADRAGLYLELTGTADQRMADTGDGNVYFAVRERGAGAGDAVVALVGVREREMQTQVRSNADATVTTKGMATRGLDAELRRFFEQQGVRFADEPWVVRTWHTPQSMLTGVWLIVGMAVGAAAVLFLVQRAEARKAGGA